MAFQIQRFFSSGFDSIIFIQLEGSNKISVTYSVIKKNKIEKAKKRNQWKEVLSF